MPKTPEKVPEKPRRRVSVGRKRAEPEVPFDIQVAIEQAIAGLDIEALRKILISQEVQLNALRMIVFDLQTILRQESQRRGKPVTKERFNKFITAFRKTIETNSRDLAGAHPNPDEVNLPMMEQAISDEDRDRIIEETFGPLDDWRVPEGEDTDEMEDTLERAVADTEDAEQAINSRRRAVRAAESRNARPRPRR